MYEPKPLTSGAIPRALERAERYRLLNEPVEAESICLDVLDAEPGNQRALVMLILAMTDQFSHSESAPAAKRAREYTDELTDEYQRAYYGGIIREREARARLRRGSAAVFAYDGLRDAMDWYERAERLRPEGNDEAILRWNACLRTIRRSRLRPWSEERQEQPLE